MSFYLLRKTQIIKEIKSHSENDVYEVKIPERSYPTCHSSPVFSGANEHFSLHQIKKNKQTDKPKKTQSRQITKSHRTNGGKRTNKFYIFNSYYCLVYTSYLKLCLA